MNIITVKKIKNKKINLYKTKTCYIYQVPKYLSKGIAFIVYMCVCVCVCVFVFVCICALSSFVHEHRAFTVHQTCPRKNQKRQRGGKVNWQ